MRKWRYKLVTGWLTEAELNAFGAEGWELVAVVITPVDHNFEYVFKRARTA